jgi:tetratricopeptide (TPR) repeat protein
MNITEFYYRVVDYPTWLGLKWSVGAAVALIVIAAVLLVAGKLRWFARALGLIALVIIMGVLYDIQGQTVQLVSFGHSRHLPRHSPAIRIGARCGMVAVPAIAIAIMVSGWGATKRTLRSEVPQQLKSGRQLFLKQDHDSALREYNRAIQAAPELAEAYWGRGCVHHAKGDLAPALADFQKAIDSDPRFARAYLERAKIRCDLGDFDGALGDYGQLTTLQANDPALYLGRGICFMKKGHHEDAAADFRRVLKLTNHTDFAEPAKSYLHQCEPPQYPSPASAPSPNGWPADSPVQKSGSPNNIV